MDYPKHWRYVNTLLLHMYVQWVISWFKWERNDD